MENLPQISPQVLASQNRIGTSITCGNNFSLAGNQGTVNFNFTAPAVPVTRGGPVTLRRDYYNLFVVSGPLVDPRQFAIPRPVCLCDGPNREEQEKYRTFTAENIAKITAMPSLLLERNEYNGIPREAQIAYFGYVYRFEILDESVMFNFNALDCVQQIPLTKLLDKLNLAHTEFVSELDKHHWSIKRADLIDVLTSFGLLDRIYDLRYPKSDETKNGK